MSTSGAARLDLGLRDDPRAPRPTRLVWAVDRATGVTGWGEAAPLAGYTVDTAPAVHDALAPLAGRSIHLELESPAAPAIEAALASLGPTLAAAPAARFAIETALLDVRARSACVSVAALIADPATPVAAVRTSALVSARDSARTAIARIRSGGFVAAKIKLAPASDGGFARTVQMLTELRRELGPSFELRLDANRAWSVAEARARLAQLAPLALAFVEEPSLALEELGPTATAWAADESLQPVAGADPEAKVRRLLEEPSCAVLVLKPHALGGSLRALAAARLARRAGRGAVITHMFDGPVAVAAACELALGLGSELAACGLDPHDARTAALPHLSTPGCVAASGTVGLGAVPEVA